MANPQVRGAMTTANALTPATAVEPRIVEAVAVGAAVRGPNGRVLAERIRMAMEKAVVDASAEGLRVNEDAPAIRERMLKAREEAKAAYYAEVAAGTQPHPQSPAQPPAQR